MEIRKESDNMDLIPRRFYLDDFFDNFISKEDSKMKCDIYEKNGDYHIEMEIPGFNKEDINIEVQDGYLKITAEKSESENKEEKNYIRRERSFGKYQRSFYLGNLDANKIEANFKDGILNIIVPKIEEEKNKKIIDIK